MKNQKHKKLKAFSMLQIMGAILIAGILTALAVPSIMSAVTKAKQVEAKNQLEHLRTLQELYRLEYSKFSTDLSEIEYEQQTLVTEGGKARYKIEITEAAAASFTARATAVEDFDGDGIFNVWEINQDQQLKETQKD